MWYFTWILGVGVALGFGIINVMWLETNGKFARDPQQPNLSASSGSAAGSTPSTPLAEDKRS
ncbi:cytochrome bd-I oxidase subunit CydX [Paraburkholderia sp. ZP32-5]|uniref:cytochrome bd-I oxidase subunit CydX n=1 Tax=Paraburkholderia sp. ZP32-5 TaxID=2883245 RepID=UPI001F421716|nr:cytochrome bd-I oxidase subunit CydX [Paraburkholderia sp. ZP32-5]